MSRDHPIRVFLCDDVQAFRALMRFVLEENPDITVVGEAADGRAGVDGVAREKPDVVLLDLSMPVLDGLEAIPLMLDVSPGTQIIGLSGFTADRMAETMIAQGRWPTSRRAPTSRTSRRRFVIWAHPCDSRNHIRHQTSSMISGAWSEGLVPLR